MGVMELIFRYRKEIFPQASWRVNREVNPNQKEDRTSIGEVLPFYRTFSSSI